ncbi:MAG: type II toxin-antitoxin system RelE/ParE family toxin [Euzebyales bacterium]|nr:type II toxin-antitoxin system RelE/ParE family toxin [Euzebyales bacterium]
MTRPVGIEPEARAELEDAAQWYDKQHRGLGLAFLAAVDRAIAHLATWPDAGTPIGDIAVDLPVRQVRVDRFPYRIAYLVIDDAIQVLAFMHDRRRPGYWHPRLDG